MDTADAAKGRRRPQGDADRTPVDSRGPWRVLVCDDEPSVRALLRVNLELDGFEVEEATSGDVVLDMLRESDTLPDVITLDALMPDTDGWRTTRLLREDPLLCHIPVVMVTASSDPADRARAAAVDVDVFVSKPFEPAEVVQAVMDLAGRGRGGHHPLRP